MMFEQAKNFFKLPIEVKMAIKMVNFEANRGYSPVGSEKLTNIDKHGGSEETIKELNA